MSNAASLVFYIGVFLLSVLFVYWGSRKRAPRLKIALGNHHLTINPRLIIGVAIPILVAGLRQDVGTDFTSYLVEYNAATQSGSYLEASFNIIANISNSIFGSPTFMFIVFSAMTVIPVMLALNKCSAIRKEYRWIFWMLFLFIMFPQTLNLLRQGVSVAIGFYLIVSIVESRKLLSLSHVVWLLLAVSFHTSAWILILVGYVAHLMNNTKKKSIAAFIFVSSVMILVCFSILPQLLNILGGAWSGYLDKDTISRGVIPRSLLILSILMICWKFRGTLKITNSYIALLWSGLLVSIGGLFVAYFERIGYYVTLLVPLLVLVVIAQNVSRNQIRIVSLGVSVLALLYFIGVYYVMGSSDIFPYNFVQQGVA